MTGVRLNLLGAALLTGGVLLNATLARAQDDGFFLTPPAVASASGNASSSDSGGSSFDSDYPSLS